MKLVLVCYSGSSASILKDRMLAWARANLLDVEIIVSSLAGLDEDKEDADIVLVGPQVRCALASVRERVPRWVALTNICAACCQRWYLEPFSGITVRSRSIWAEESIFCTVFSGDLQQWPGSRFSIQ